MIETSEQNLCNQLVLATCLFVHGASPGEFSKLAQMFVSVKQCGMLKNYL
jgi:hypothetical protein